MSDRKRPLEGNADASAAKRTRSDTATPSNGATSAEALPQAALIAQKKAEVQAKLAAMQKKAASLALKPPTSAASSVSATPSSRAGPGHSPSPSVTDDLARKAAEVRRKVAEAQSKLAVKDNPYMSMPQTGRKNKPAEPSQQGAGLKMTAHPLLLDTLPSAPQSKKDRYKPMQPKFPSMRANVRNMPTPSPAPTPTPTPKENPYAAAASPATDTGFEGAPKERVGRSLKFNPKGKYVALANQQRQEAQLEALKQRIAESARKAGLDSEFDTLEKNIRRDPPPDVEWWDASLLPHKTYDDLTNLDLSLLNIRNESSPINLYIQHPIPIVAPSEKNGAKPLMLTKKEQKKMRKQRRQAELQDKRDRIRMGLIPPDPPKVRLANLMKVLTSDAVQDPTRVEARVRREVAMRKHGHEKMNTERKLTDEQRREKVEAKKVEEEKKGIFGAVFKVKTLSDPAHRYKVRKNAEQMNLSGVVIFNPSFSLVYVEGASKFIRNYKRLMLHRLAWTEAARARGEEDVVLASPEPQADEKGKGKAEDVSEVSLENNRCDLVWEGQLRDRAFTNFRPKSCPTDAAAREVLGAKLTGYWDMAKNWKPEDEDTPTLELVPARELVVATSGYCLLPAASFVMVLRPLRLRLWPQQTTKQAQDIVRQVLRSSPTPLSTKDIFKQALQLKLENPVIQTDPYILRARKLSEAQGTPQPPQPQHPIRSLSYLKRTVLPDLVKLRDIEKVHSERLMTDEEIDHRLASMTKAQRAAARSMSTTVHSWLWQEKAVKGPLPKVEEKEEKVFGAEVGVGEDWSHLNRRRQRAREGKVTRDVKWVRKLERAKLDGSQEDAPAASA
ncbi:hypothetical protein EW146_g1571 [Bondarzewia mesenterica]|uniref:Uncharacterized protein n=1 Tax=Bondarzewia mesenterica TaxID=1095465 RepID=A0A4S4M3H6_9AGAM|nr:hypothetical protein EW146_g1571 [Bondarzewia mesenterica]